MNAFVHQYSVFYVVFISQIISFLLIPFIPIFILRAICTHTGGRYCTHVISIVFIFESIFFNIYFYNITIINSITLRHLFILELAPDHQLIIHFLIYLDITFLILHIYFYVDLIALIVLYVLYFSIFFIVFYVYIYGRLV